MRLSSSSSKSMHMPCSSKGTVRMSGSYAEKACSAPRYVGPSVMMMSPGSQNVFATRSSASWAPVVMMTFSGLCLMPRSRTMSQNTWAVSSKPSVPPYCSVTAWSSMAAFAALRTALLGKSDTSGMPPASEMTSSRWAAANRSLTAEGRILVMRRATLSVAVSNLMCASFMIGRLTQPC